MHTPTEGAQSRAAREFIGSDNGNISSKLGVPAPTPQTGTIRAKVQTEVRSTDGAALWVVKGFSKLDDKPGFCVFSPEFFMAGTWWKMQLFPSGGGRNDAASSDGHASLYLFATRAPAKAKYSLALLKAPPVVPPQPDTGAADGAILPGTGGGAITTTTTPGTGVPSTPGTAGPSTSSTDTATGTATSTQADSDRLADEAGVLYVCHGSTKSFGSPSEGWGFLKFYSRKQLMIGQWAARDEIRLEANVSVVTGIHHTADSRNPGGTHMSSVTQFQHQMANLIDNPAKADVTFAIYAGARGTSKPTIIRAHNLILTTRSSYFSAMLDNRGKGGMAESKSGRVIIEHCRPSVFKQLLRFIYTGACDLSGVGNEKPTKGETASVIQSLEDDFVDAPDSAPMTVSGSSHSALDGKGEKVTQEDKFDEDDDAIYGDDVDDFDDLDASIDESAMRQRKQEQAERREKWGRKRQQRAISGRVGDAVSDAALELLCAADRFDAADLRGLCEHYLMDTLSSLNCVHRCRMADMIGRLPLLRAMCVKFITELSPTVRTAKSFTDQLYALPRSLLIELMSAQPAVHSLPAPTPPPPPPSSSLHPALVPDLPGPLSQPLPSSSLQNLTGSVNSGSSSSSSSSLSNSSSSSLSNSSSGSLSIGSSNNPSSNPSNMPSRKRGAEEMLEPSPHGAGIPQSTNSTRDDGPPPSVISALLAGGGTTSPQMGGSGPVGGGGGGGGGGSNSDDDLPQPAKRLRMSDIAVMRVPELKDELSRRGVSKAGKKAELVARLSAFCDEQPQPRLPRLPIPGGSTSSSQLSSFPFLAPQTAPLSLTSSSSSSISTSSSSLSSLYSAPQTAPSSLSSSSSSSTSTSSSSLSSLHSASQTTPPSLPSSSSSSTTSSSSSSSTFPGGSTMVNLTTPSIGTNSSAFFNRSSPPPSSPEQAPGSRPRSPDQP